jgi:hypothetical protein
MVAVDESRRVLQHSVEEGVVRDWLIEGEP